MDDDMKKKALAWIECRKTIRTCDCCGNNSWTFGEDIVTTPILSGGGMVIGGKSYPHVMLICNSCGNTKFFNAVKMGLLEPAPAQEGGKNG